MYPYIERELSQGRISAILPGICWACSRVFLARGSGGDYLSENAHKAGADINVLEHALKLVADKR